MFDFISQNASAISAVANVIMVLVWVTYLHLLLISFMRQRRSSLIVSSSVSPDDKPTAFVSNMSEGRFHIQNVAAAVRVNGKLYRGDVTEPTADNHETSFQRPLADGQSLDLGPFEKLLERVEATQSDLPSNLLEKFGELDLYIIIIGIHGASRKAVAARRGFRLHLEDGKLKSSGLGRYTEQFRWGRARERIVQESAVIN